MSDRVKGVFEARIYVGLNDKDVRQQLFDTEDYKAELKDICMKYHAPFSVQTWRAATSMTTAHG